MFEGLISKVFTNSLTNECPSTIEYSPIIGKFTANFNFLCATGKDLFSHPSSAQMQQWELKVDCASIPDDLKIYNVQIGDSGKSFAATCFAGSGQEAKFMSNFNSIYEIASIRNVQIIQSSIFDNLRAVCNCITMLNNDSDEHSIKENIIEESNLLTPANIAALLTSTVIASVGAYALYKKFKSKNRYSKINYFEDDPKYNENDDQDYNRSSRGIVSHDGNRMPTRASVKYTGYNYFAEDSDYKSSDDPDYNSDSDNDSEDDITIQLKNLSTQSKMRY